MEIVDYTPHLIRALDWYDDVSKKYPGTSTFELVILTLREGGLAYGDIQKWLGMPPKSKIREVLLKWNPNLIDIDTNYQKLQKKNE